MTNATLPKRQIADDFTPRAAGRKNDTLALWEPEIEAIFKDTACHGKVVKYDGVDANVATTLRNNFEDIDVKIRQLDKSRYLDKDGNPVTDKADAAVKDGKPVENPNFNKGRLEIFVPDPKAKANTPPAK